MRQEIPSIHVTLDNVLHLPHHKSTINLVQNYLVSLYRYIVITERTLSYMVQHLSIVFITVVTWINFVA